MTESYYYPFKRALIMLNMTPVFIHSNRIYYERNTGLQPKCRKSGII